MSQVGVRIVGTTVTGAGAAWRHIVLHKLLLQLLLLLSLPCDLSFLFAFLGHVTVLLLLLLIKIDRGPLPCEVVAHTLVHRAVLGSVIMVFQDDLGQVLSEGGRLLVGVRCSTVSTAVCVVDTLGVSVVVEGLSGIQDLAQAFLHGLHQVP